jgi:GTP-binding protein YchF
MRVALLGLPQAGKRTLFRLLTGRTVPDSRRPGEAVDGAGPIRDPRVDVLSGICKPQKTTYAENTYALCPDVAPGADSRDWLDAARRCDLIALVVRAFPSDVVYHPDGSVNSERDRKAIESELMLADMLLIEKRLERLTKEARAKRTPALTREEETLRRCSAALENGRPVRDAGLDAEALAPVKSLGFVTLLPLRTLLNVGDDALGGATPPDALPVSCRIEEEIAAIANAEERREYLEALGLTAPGLDRVNAAVYDALGLMSFYTTGEDEVRAWTIRRGATAPVAGGKIHSDIERGFIRVEVIKYDDFVACGSEKAAKEAGKVQLRGRDYVMEDGDICHFLFNV